MAARFVGTLGAVCAVMASALPPPLSIINLIDGDDVFNVTTGTPGSCSCEKPACNLNPSTGNRLFFGDEMTFTSDNCEYYNIGGGVADATGNPCATWRADQYGCTVSPGGVTGDCSRLSGVACSMTGSGSNLTATVDRDCDALPYGTCTPGVSDCCGENACALAEPSTTYYMCQPVV